jgi:hypothetical protein
MVVIIQSALKQKFISAVKFLCSEAHNIAKFTTLLGTLRFRLTLVGA